ncbi:MAG TPA: type II toxin-antitoxin system Phd/YefM family antitoxin [Longimicrobium sp.]|nr:type II toxin-antitoxin system Phd/YefM family antitoxin [Longimicrobium sp.]
MLKLEDIYSLTDFQRNTREHVRRLQESRRPTLLTVNGRAEVVVQDAGSYQELLDRIERAEAILAIQEGLESAARGEGRSARDLFDEIRKNARSPG